MSSARTTLFFLDGTGYGWSETFYYAGSPDIPTTTLSVLALATARAGILTSTCTLTHARVESFVARNPVIIPLAAGAGIPGSETPPTAPSEVALLVRLAAGLTGYNRPFMRGIPLRVVQADTFVPDAAFTAELNVLFGVLNTSIWNAVGTLGGSPTHLPITTLVPTSPRGFSITFAAAQALTLGQTLRIAGARVPGYNGLKRIVEINSPVIAQVGGAAPPVPDSGSSPYALIPGTFDAQITDTFVERLTRRAAGRPFGQSRGRKPTLYSLRR
jgi:hypothetical protein